MLRARVLPEVLGQIVGDGIDATMCVSYLAFSSLSPCSALLGHAAHAPGVLMLMTLDGALMGSFGDANVVDHKVVGAIASHTWGEYAHSSKEFNAGHALQTLLMELEDGRLAISAAGKGFLVCAYSNGDAEPGFIKAKVEALGAFLSSSLDQINV